MVLGVGNWGVIDGLLILIETFTFSWEQLNLSIRDAIIYRRDQHSNTASVGYSNMSATLCINSHLLITVCASDLLSLHLTNSAHLQWGPRPLQGASGSIFGTTVRCCNTRRCPADSPHECPPSRPIAIISLKAEAEFWVRLFRLWLETRVSETG